MRARVHAVWVRLRGVRARLVAVYVVIATGVSVAGIAAFLYLLDGALDQNLEADLRASGVSAAADVSSGRVERIAQPPTIDPAEQRTPLVSVVATYDPSGRLVSSEPARLPADPAREARGSGISSGRYDGRAFTFLRRTATDQQGRTWTIVVGQSLSTAADAQGDARDALYVIVPIAIVLSGLGAWLLSGAALRPVDRMRRDAQRLSETGTPGRIGPPGTSDSLDRLAVTFNTLLDRLHDSLQRQRDFVADAGHELRTPLAVLQTELETADRPSRSRADLADSIRHAQAETARLAALSEDLLLLAQADSPARLIHRELVEVADVVAACVTAWGDEADAARVTLTAHGLDPAVVAELDPVAVRRALDNLLANALRHTPDGGSVAVRMGTRPDAVTLVVEDTGPGFPEDFLPHAFERFSRADRSRSRSHGRYGSGLGLSIVETVVVAHGGTVTARNRPGGGARLTISLPVTAPG